MNRYWVVDSSPLILLAKIEKIALLHELSDQLVIPIGVAQEIQQGVQEDPARQWLKNQGHVWIQETVVVIPTISAWLLGLGETQVLSYAKAHSDYIAIVDDRAARNCAKTSNIPVRGTLGILLLAKKLGQIPEIKPLLIQLQKVGLRVSNQLINETLRLANEPEKSE